MRNTRTAELRTSARLFQDHLPSPGGRIASTLSLGAQINEKGEQMGIRDLFRRRTGVPTGRQTALRGSTPPSGASMTSTTKPSAPQAVGADVEEQLAALGAKDSVGRPDDAVRRDAVAALTAAGPGVVRPLMAHLETSTLLQNVDEQSGVADVLAGLGGSGVEPLLAVLQDASPGSLQFGHALEALGAIGDPRAVDPLLRLLDEQPDLNRRADVVKALGAVGDPRAVDPLLRLLDEQPDLDFAALGFKDHVVEALGAIGDPQAVDPLLRLLDEQPADMYQDHLVLYRAEQLKTHTVAALDLCGWRPDRTRAGALYWATKWLYVNVADARGSLAATGWEPDQSEAGAAMLVATERWDEAVAAGLTAVRPLFTRLQESDRALRERAADALQRIGPQAAGELAQLLDNSYLFSHDNVSSLTLRVEAARVLGEMGDPVATDALVKMGSTVEDTKEHRRAAADAIGKIGEPAVPRLLELLEDDRHATKELVAWALGRTGDRRAVQPLIDVLSAKVTMPPPYVKEAAHEALTMIAGEDLGASPGAWQEWAATGTAP